MRRCFVAILIASACAAPAQVTSKPPPLVGLIHGGTAETAKASVEAFRKGLEELGYREGRDIVVEPRYMAGQGADRAADLTAELIKAGAAAIVTGNPAGVVGARRASSTIPIVMAGVGPDPVGQGLVSSLARPGGNVTGLSLQVPTAPGRRLQLLHEIVPGTTRVGVLWDATLGDPGPVIAALEPAARSLGIELKLRVAKDVAEIDAAIPALRSDGATALHVHAGALFGANVARITALALAQKLPTSIGIVEGVRAGALFTLGVDQTVLYRRAATYVDKILKGATPADLPVERPEKFELIVNLKTAQALGITVPESVLAQATEIIR